MKSSTNFFSLSQALYNSYMIALVSLAATLFPTMSRAAEPQAEFELPPVELHENRTVEVIERLLDNDLESALIAILNSREDTLSIKLEGELEVPVTPPFFIGGGLSVEYAVAISDDGYEFSVVREASVKGGLEAGDLADIDGTIAGSEKDIYSFQTVEDLKEGIISYAIVTALNQSAVANYLLADDRVQEAVLSTLDAEKNLQRKQQSLSSASAALASAKRATSRAKSRLSKASRRLKSKYSKAYGKAKSAQAAKQRAYNAAAAAVNTAKIALAAAQSELANREDAFSVVETILQYIFNAQEVLNGSHQGFEVGLSSTLGLGMELGDAVEAAGEAGVEIVLREDNATEDSPAIRTVTRTVQIGSEYEVGLGMKGLAGAGSLSLSSEEEFSGLGGAWEKHWEEISFEADREVSGSLSVGPVSANIGAGRTVGADLPTDFNAAVEMFSPGTSLASIENRWTASVEVGLEIEGLGSEVTASLNWEDNPVDSLELIIPTTADDFVENVLKKAGTFKQTVEELTNIVDDTITVIERLVLEAVENHGS